eukprot:CAMPEP_0198313202 /NCGR_PEP_ID=MMETSP1450-20131203/4299_1 /TAXON_ID=753684 ORGANISM="Madagascaria erythrocladiodes, Strain CCMP3234" /NCGR_SAMPLE_ID=MMETSP1450 /ASSEMBLY_ACC=CAM_ASM_001115 /LENGTH=167 /DNA_ID=CAMNT_0044016183 /DNA_START=25 /DNA_END=524 /DNA_ORIENTATION=+
MASAAPAAEDAFDDGLIHPLFTDFKPRLAYDRGREVPLKESLAFHFKKSRPWYVRYGKIVGVTAVLSYHVSFVYWMVRPRLQPYRAMLREWRGIVRHFAVVPRGGGRQAARMWASGERPAFLPRLRDAYFRLPEGYQKRVDYRRAGRRATRRAYLNTTRLVHVLFLA